MLFCCDVCRAVDAFDASIGDSFIASTTASNRSNDANTSNTRKMHLEADIAIASRRMLIAGTSLAHCQPRRPS